jgi:hypothetical protein
MAGKEIKFGQEARATILEGVNALANSNDSALLRLFLGGIRDDDTGGCHSFLLDAFYDNPVMQWSDVHN